MSDEGFREIQLNGKQLIFLFMAVTVVSVVIFLFGVLVGRGVRQGTDTGEVVSGQVAPDSAGVPATDNAAPPTPAGTSGSQGPAAPVAEELSYAERLLRDTPADEKLKPSAASGAAAAAAPVVQEPVAEKPPPASQSPTKETAPAAAAAAPPTSPPTSVPAPGPGVSPQVSDPAGPGFAVQVAAYRDRGDADRLAKQLTAKGYPAFVMDPVKGTSTTMFRVRVGKYKTRKDAEAIEVRLQNAEQLTNAWIAR